MGRLNRSAGSRTIHGRIQLASTRSNRSSPGTGEEIPAANPAWRFTWKRSRGAGEIRLLASTHPGAELRRRRSVIVDPSHFESTSTVCITVHMIGKPSPPSVRSRSSRHVP